MSLRRTARRSLAVATLLAPMVVALSAGPANAADTFTSPASNAVFTAPRTVAVEATLDACPATTVDCPSSTLTVTAPDGAVAGKTTKVSARNSTSQITVDVATGSANNANGRWTATLSGDTQGSRAFFTHLAPNVPSGFSADATGQHDVFLSWNKGSEKDLRSYVLYDGSGTVIDGSISASSACSGSTCSYALYYDNASPGTYAYDYQLAAVRSGGGCPGCSATVQSNKTATRSATLTTPEPEPTPDPTPTSGGGSTGGTTGGSSGSTSGGSAGGTSGGTSGGSSSGGTTSGTTGGTSGGSSTGTSGGTAIQPGAKPTLPALDAIAAQRRAFALNFNAFAPSLGIPKLPPLPATTFTAGEQPLPMGTYQPQLPYGSASETVKTGGFVDGPLSIVSSEIDQASLARSLAVALILVLAAGHLRRWIGTHQED